MGIPVQHIPVKQAWIHKYPKMTKSLYKSGMFVLGTCMSGAVASHEDMLSCLSSWHGNEDSEFASQIDVETTREFSQICRGSHRKCPQNLFRCPSEFDWM